MLVHALRAGLTCAHEWVVTVVVVGGWGRVGGLEVGTHLAAQAAAAV